MKNLILGFSLLLFTACSSIGVVLCSCDVILEDGTIVRKEWKCNRVQVGSASFPATGCREYDPDAPGSVFCNVVAETNKPNKCCSDFQN